MVDCGGRAWVYLLSGAVRFVLLVAPRDVHPGGVDDDTQPVDGLTRSAAVLQAGLAMSELDVQQLWVDYLTLDGFMTPSELEEVLRGEREVSAGEHDLLAQVLNGVFTTRGHNHPVPHAEEVDVDQTSRRPLQGTRYR